MSSIYTNISETAERVIDPISQQIIHSTLKKLNCYEYFKDYVHIKNDRTSSSIYTNTDYTTNFDSQQRVDVTVDTRYNPADSQLFDKMSMGVNTPSLGIGNYNDWAKRIIFSDPAIGFYVRETNMPFTLSLAFSMFFKDYGPAISTLSAILNRTHGDFVNEVHDVVYSYPFDFTSWALLNQVFKRRLTYRERNPKADILDYLDSISQAQWGFDIRRPDLTETAAGKAESELAVTRQQISCSAKLEYSGGKPEPVEEENGIKGYTIEFNYIIQFGRPHLLQFEVPPHVEQNPLPYIFFEDSPETDDINLSGEFNVPQVTGMIYSGNNVNLMRQSRFKIPAYDSWFVPPTSMLKKRKFITSLEALTLIEDDTHTCTVDLKEDFDGVKIADWVLDILGTMDRGDILNYSGLFNITVFVNDIALDHEFIEWDPKTKIIKITGLKRESTYRLVLAEATVLDYIDIKWKNTLIEYRQYVPCALMRTMSYLSQVGVLFILGDTDFMTFVSTCVYNDTIKNISEKMISLGTSAQIRQYYTDPQGYAKYICNTMWKDRRFTLFDLFIQTAKDLGYLTNRDTFGRNINIDGTYNYDFTTGGLPNGHSDPLRVFKAGIPDPTRRPRSGS